MATPNPGEPPIQAPVTDDKGNMTVPWHLWCVMMWKKIGGGSAMSLAWGSITGVISAQADLVAALAAKVTGNAAITGATHTKITYDTKGLVTSGSDLIAADIPNIAESQVTNLVSDLAGKQAALGYTPENVANKDTDGTLAANSDTKYPSQKAVKTYVDGHASAAPTGTGFPHLTSGAYDAAAVAETGTGSVVRASAPTLTNPVVGTQSPGDNSTKAASTAYADAAAAAVSTGGTVTHTAGSLAAHAVVIGNGSADEKTIATGTAGQYLRSGGASADPAMASIAESEVTNLVSDLALKATKVLTTKGDLATFDTVENRLGVGADGLIVMADSAQTKGIKWGNFYYGNGYATASTTSSTVNLGSTPLTDSVRLYVNGLLKVPSAYSVSGTTITLGSAISGGDVVVCNWVTLNSTPGGITIPVTYVSIRGSGIQSSSASSYTVSWPAGTIAGDLAVICVAHGWVATTPSGWTSTGALNGSNINGAVFSKVLSSGDISTGNVSISFSGSFNGVLAIVTFVGSTAGLREAQSRRDTTGSATVAGNSSSSVLNTDTAIYFVASRAISTNTVNRGTSLQSISATEASAGLYYENIVSSGTVNITASFSNSGGANAGDYIAIPIIKAV